MTHDFQSKLAFSLGEQEKVDMDTLRSVIPGCVSVRKTTPAEDRTGVDYIATLRGGAEIFIDAKTRERGASRYWRRGEAEIALEKWSVVCSAACPQGKAGWTLSEASPVHYILYTFDRSDWGEFYLLPFQLLRAAFRRNCAAWEKAYQAKQQNSGRWKSEAIFVPVSVVLSAVSDEMRIAAQ